MDFTPPNSPPVGSDGSVVTYQCPPAPKTTSRKKPKKDYYCICNWGNECQEIFSFFEQHLPDDDPWNGKPFEHRPSKTVNASNANSKAQVKATAYRKIVHSLFQKDDEGKRFFTACHHFSRIMLKTHTGHRTTLLKRKDVKELDENINVLHHGYEVKNFRVHTILNKNPHMFKVLLLARTYL